MNYNLIKSKLSPTPLAFISKFQLLKSAIILTSTNILILISISVFKCRVLLALTHINRNVFKDFKDVFYFIQGFALCITLVIVFY